MLKPGDKVAVLDDDLEGKVVAVNGNHIIIETLEGFELEYLEKELVKLEGSLPDALPSDSGDFSEILKEKESPRRQKSRRIKPKERNVPPMEVDLHVNKLVNSSRGMNNFEILNLQMETAKRQLEFAMKKRIQKIVFIHGVGEGVLKAELETLFHRYDNLKFYDADYQKYGLGATEVYIFQNY